MSINIVGFTSTNKLPAFFGETVYGAGPITIGSIPLVCLVSGTMLESTGTATPNASIDQILSLDDSDTLHGAGSEINLMCQAALRIPGVKLLAAPSAEAVGAVAATVTITITLFGSNPTSSGEFAYRIDGRRYTGVIRTTDTLSSIATAIAASINADPHSPVTAAVGAGPTYIVTATRKSAGARGNQGVLFQESDTPAGGVTSAIAGGTAITGGGVHFTGGTGTEDVSALLAVLSAQRYNRIAFAQNDAANAALWEAQLNTKAGVLEGKTEHAICAVSDSLSASITLSTVTLNAERVQLLWYLNSENHPSEIAAVFAAARTAAEQSNPNQGYDGYVLPGIVAQSQSGDWPTTATLISALDNGVTPIATSPSGEAYIVRSIVTHCLNGALPDYRTLDTAQAVVPDYVRDVLELYWVTVYKVANPYVADDPAPEQRERPPGVATPTRWNQTVTSILKDLESQNILSDVELNPPVSEYDPVAKRIMSLVPAIATPLNHQTGVSVRQVG